MKYYKQVDQNNNILFLLTYSTTPNITDPLVIEITEEEYNTLQAELAAKWEPENPEQETEEFAGEQDYLDALALLGVE